MKSTRGILTLLFVLCLWPGLVHAQWLAMPAPAFDPHAGWNPYPGFPGGGWGGQVPQPPPMPPQVPGFSRTECVNFDFHGLAPSALLKLRITRTAAPLRKVLYQRALFVMKFETDQMVKNTANWVRLQIEQLPRA